jgi:hypothetical protein
MGAMTQSLSVAIVAMNEAANLARTLASVRWASEIVLVDSGSTDRTVEIARSHGAKVYIESWKGYGGQVNSALDKCSGPWILNIDADEEVTPQLAAEIQSLLHGQPVFNAYTVPRLNNIFGRWMRHGGLYPDRKLRLFRKGAARLREDTEPHATPKTSEQTGRLSGDLLHYQYPTLEIYIQHMRTYSTATIPLILRRRKTGAVASAVHLQYAPQPSAYVRLQLHFARRLPGRARRPALPPLPLGLRELEVRESVGGSRAQPPQPARRQDLTHLKIRDAITMRLAPIARCYTNPRIQGRSCRTRTRVSGSMRRWRNWQTH